MTTGRINQVTIRLLLQGYIRSHKDRSIKPQIHAFVRYPSATVTRLHGKRQLHFDSSITLTLAHLVKDHQHSIKMSFCPIPRSRKLWFLIPMSEHRQSHQKGDNHSTKMI